MSLKSSLLVCTILLVVSAIVALILAIVLGNLIENSSVAFLSDREGSLKIYVIDVDHRIQQQLNNNEMTTSLYSISPNGEQIASVQLIQEDTQVLVTDVDGVEIYHTSGGISLSPTWSPDSGLLAFTMSIADTSNVYLIDLDTKVQQQITSLSRTEIPLLPTWSPNGLFIAYVIKDKVHITDLNDFSSYTLLSPLNDGISAVSWSPAGDQIAFVLQIREESYFESLVCIADIYIKTTNCLSEEIRSGYIGKPAWSPDSRYLAYVAFYGDYVTLNTLDMTTHETHQLFRQSILETSSPNSGIGDPIWSPEGRYLIYELFGPRGRSDGTQIYMISTTDGTPPQLITDGISTNTFPVLWLNN